ARLESKCRSRRNVEPVAVGLRTIESQMSVHFEEVRMGSHLDRTIAVIVDAHSYSRRAGVELDRLVPQDVFAGNHGSADGIVDGHQLGAVREGAFDLHFVNHLRNAFHDIVARQDLCAQGHQLGDGFSVTYALEHFSGDEGDGFRVIELQAARLAAPRDVGGSKDQQLVDFTLGETHGD